MVIDGHQNQSADPLLPAVQALTNIALALLLAIAIALAAAPASGYKSGWAYYRCVAGAKKSHSYVRHKPATCS